MNIGIIGTGRIVHRFVAEMSYVDGTQLAAIYNPRKSSTIYFVESNGLNAEGILLTDDKEEFFSAVEAVYIAAPHEFHYGYAKEALLAGKHVLCEKPMALQGAQAKELYELAEEHHLILMEAIKTASCPGFQKMLQLLESGVIGQPYDVEATFTKIGTAAGREIWGEAGGSFVELGSYPLLPIVKIFGTKVEQSSVWSLPTVVGTDAYTKMVITYDQGIATLKTGLGVKSEGELIIAGESGYVKLPAPWWLTSTIEVHHENPNRVEVYKTPFEGSGLRYEIDTFVKRISREENTDILRYITPQESIWMAEMMEGFLASRHDFYQERQEQIAEAENMQNKRPNIWAHRGCSCAYPENTLLAFEKAAQVPGIAGIELDVQLTKDGELVVIHDETVNRTTNGEGYVKDYTLAELKALQITPSGRDQVYVTEQGKSLTIPTLRELFELLQPYCKKNHLMINIELKNSKIRYEGMEEKVINLVTEFGLEDNIVYSSFLHESVGLVKERNPNAKTGTLSDDLLDCLEGARTYHADASHPSNFGMAINADTVRRLIDCEIPIRMWNGKEPLFGQSRTLKECDLEKYTLLGATDIITNVPEIYLGCEENRQ